MCASGGTPEGRRTASPLACRSLTQRVLVLERGLVSLHHGCCAFVHKDCFPFVSSSCSCVVLPKDAINGPFSPRQSEPLAALPPLSRPLSVKLTRALSGGGLPSSSGLRPLWGALSKRALRLAKRSSVSDLVMMIETVPRDLTPRIKKGGFFFFYCTCTFPFLRLPQSQSSYLKLEHGGNPAFWKFPEVNVFHRIFAAVSSRKKPPQRFSQNMTTTASREEDGKSPAPAEGRQSIYIAR